MIRGKIEDIEQMCQDILSHLVGPDVNIVLDEVKTDVGPVGICLLEKDGNTTTYRSSSVSRSLAEMMFTFPIQNVAEESRKINIYTEMNLEDLEGPGYENLLGLSHLTKVQLYNIDKYHNQGVIYRRRKEAVNLNETNNNLRGNDKGSPGECLEAN